ncbi:ATP-binding protein [Streptomyces sp. NPDC094448]|uniref:ATP-binding protein n=1 Tax=Streptomyces sp. NPDC094448 TaxID=3366063 RepID=UPI00381973E3
MFPQWFRAFPGRQEKVAEARRFVAALLEGWSVVDSAVLTVSELATNAIRHTASGATGGWFYVCVEIGADHARVTVGDQGSMSTPHLCDASGQEEGGRGLLLVSACAKDWGVESSLHSSEVWADFARDST